MKETARAGQITLLVLLLGLLGLTVALSSVSRSLQDIKQTTQTDSGAKALAGAEAGLEYGITKIDPNQVIGCTAATDVPGSNAFPGFSQFVTYQICSELRPYVEYKGGMTINDVLTVDLSAGVPPSAQNFGVLWEGISSAILVSALYKEVGGSYLLDRFAINSDTSAPSGNNFFPGKPGGLCTAPSGNSYCVTSANYDNCTTDARPADQSLAPNRIIPSKSVLGLSYNLHLLRARRLYSAGNVAVCAYGSGTGSEANPVSMNARYITVTATATTIDGTTRRVKATRVASSLPGLFDYAIFTEGALTK